VANHLDIGKGEFMRKFMIAVALVLCFSTSALGAELLMFSMKSCGYCRNFLKEVAQEYSSTEYAKILPLRIISMDRKNAPRWFDNAYDQNQIDGIRGTPTFVVFDSGKEVARLIGYNGKKRWYDDISRFINENRAKLQDRVGRNPIPFEKETEMTPAFALQESLGATPDRTHSNHQSEGSGSKHESGSSASQMQHPTVPFFAPPLGAGPKKKEDTNPHRNMLDKNEDGVIQSQDIMDHQYETVEEAIKAAQWFGCEGVHNHKIKGKLIWMPCRME